MKQTALKAKLKTYKFEPQYTIEVFQTKEMSPVFLLNMPDGEYFGFNSLHELSNFITLNYE